MFDKENTNKVTEKCFIINYNTKGIARSLLETQTQRCKVLEKRRLSGSCRTKSIVFSSNPIMVLRFTSYM